MTWLSRILSGRKVSAIFLFMILTAAVFGFAASSVVPVTGAGDGSGVVSGYTISNLRWVLDPNKPREMDYAIFDVSPSAGAGSATKVYISVNGGSSWVTCTGPSGTTWTCTLPPDVLVSGIAVIEIVSIEN